MAEMIEQRYEAAVALDRLTPHPANPNEGDIGLLCELFDANGFGGAVLAQASTGILIDGETRWRAAQAEGMGTLPVIWADVDDDTRDRMLASYNEATRRGRNKEDKLLALLQGLAMTPRGLAGAAFTGDDVDDLMARLGQPLSIGDAPNGHQNSETPEEEQEREERTGGYNDRSAGGNLVEMILVFSTDQRTEVGEVLTQIRGLRGNAEERAADLVLQGLRVLAATLEGRTEDADAIARS
jgi:hypothetical protein